MTDQINTIEYWVKQVKDRPIPVLKDTASSLHSLCKNDTMPTDRIASVIMQDPGMTIQLLRKTNQSGGRLNKEIVSVKQAVMLLGTEAMISLASTSPVIQDTLQEPAITQVKRTYCRAHHAAMQAVSWAKQRRDINYDEVATATQLHFLGEIVLAALAPELLLKTFSMRAEKNIASEEAQYLVLGFTLDQLSRALAEQWKLPELVLEALHAESALQPRGYAIALAVQLARSVSINWYSEKTTSIIEQAAELLDVSMDRMAYDVTQLCVYTSRNSNYKKILQPAALLPMLSAVIKRDANQQVDDEKHSGVCLTPQMNKLKESLEKLKVAVKEKKDDSTILNIGLEGLHDGVGLNRVVYAEYDEEIRSLVAKIVFGAENDPAFNRFSIRMDRPNLFMHLLDKTQAICINNDNRTKYWAMVPKDFQKLVGTNSFVAMSIINKQQPAQLFYADRHTSDCQIDPRTYQIFKQMCGSLSKALTMTH